MVELLKKNGKVFLSPSRRVVELMFENFGGLCAFCRKGYNENTCPSVTTSKPLKSKLDEYPFIKTGYQEFEGDECVSLHVFECERFDGSPLD